MSVSSITNLPGQPPVGFTTPRPLGGNGYQSPFMQTVCAASLTADATAGTAQFTVNFDPTYLGLVSAVHLDATTSAVDVDCRMDIVGPSAEAMRVLHVIPNITGGGGIVDNSMTWNPPPMLMTNNSVLGDWLLSVSVPNVDGQIFVMTVWVYLFEKRADEYTPIETLLACLPRTAAVT